MIMIKFYYKHILWCMVLLCSMNTIVKAQGILLGKWSGIHRFENKKGKIISINKWELVIDKVTSTGVIGFMYEYYAEDPLKSEKNLVFNKLSKSGKQPLKFDYDTATMQIKMIGSTLYREDYRNRCNGVYTGQLKIGANPTQDTIKFSFKGDTENCAVNIVTTVTRMDDERALPTINKVDLTGTWVGTFTKTSAPEIPSTTSNCKWIISEIDKTGVAKIKEINYDLKNKKDNSKTFYTAEINSDGGFEMNIDLSPQVRGIGRLYFFKVDGKHKLEAYSYQNGAPHPSFRMLLNQTSKDTTYMVPGTITPIKAGAYKFAKEIAGALAIYQFTFSNISAKQMTVDFGTYDRPFCDAAFKGTLNLISPNVWSFNDKSIPLSFELTNIDSGLKITKVKANKNDECSSYPEEATYTYGKSDPNVLVYKEQKTKSIVHKLEPKSTKITIPKGPISANPSVALLKRWKIIAKSDKSGELEYARKGALGEFHFVKGKKVFLYTEGVIQGVGEYIIAPDGKSLLMVFEDGSKSEKVSYKILKLTATELVVEIQSEPMFSNKNIIFLKI